MVPLTKMQLEMTQLKNSKDSPETNPEHHNRRRDDPPAVADFGVFLHHQLLRKCLPRFDVGRNRWGRTDGGEWLKYRRHDDERRIERREQKFCKGDARGRFNGRIARSRDDRSGGDVGHYEE